MGKTETAVLVGITSGLITAGVMFVVNRWTRWRDWRRDNIPEIEQHPANTWVSGGGERPPTYQITLWPRANVDYVVQAVKVKRPRRASFEVRSVHAHHAALNQWRKQPDPQALEDCVLRSRDVSPLSIGVSLEEYKTRSRVEIRLTVLQRPRIAREAAQKLKVVYTN